MKKTYFPVSTDQGTHTVEGYTNPGSMIGIHREGRGELWTVTFLPCGTEIDSVFPAQLRAPACRHMLLDFIAAFEAATEFALLALSTLPFGTHAVPPEFEETVAYIRAVAAAL